MFLYYQDIGPDYEPELIGEFDTLEELIIRIKAECDNGHEDVPDEIPSFDEYVAGDFSNYSDEFSYTFNLPTKEEIDILKDGDFIVIIHDDTSCEYKYFVTNYKITDDIQWYSDSDLEVNKKD